MEYFLVLICFNALVLGLLVLIFKPLFDFKITAMLGLASLGLGFSLPLSLLYFNHVTVVLIYGLAVVFFASRLSSSLSNLPDVGSIETNLATPTQVCGPADTHVSAMAGGTTGEVAGVPADEGTKTPELVNEAPDEGAKGADEVIVTTVEVNATPDVVIETPPAEPVIISPLEEDVPDATSLALADEMPVPVDDILTVAAASQTLDAEQEPLHMITADLVEAACAFEETVPADTGTLMDELAQDRHEELPALNESPSVLPSVLPQANGKTNDVPAKEWIPDDQEQDIFSIIKAGFDARSMGDTALALGLFIRGLDYSHDPQLSLLMAKEISDIYKESGQYFLAATILRSLADSGSGLSLPEQRVLLEQAGYLEQMEPN